MTNLRIKFPRGSVPFSPRTVSMVSYSISRASSITVTHIAVFSLRPVQPIRTYLAPLCANATDIHNTDQSKYISHPQLQVFNSCCYLSTHLGQKPGGHPGCSLLTSPSKGHQILPCVCHTFFPLHLSFSAVLSQLWLSYLLCRLMPELAKLIFSYSVVLSP